MANKKAVLEEVEGYEDKVEKADEKHPKSMPGADLKLKNWHLAMDDDDVLWLHFDKEKSGANVLSTSVLKELAKVVEEVEKNLPAALVIKSDKKGGFCAGADITEFLDLDDRKQIEGMMGEVHDLFDRLENLPVPIIAVIHGHCLGGGLELALACQYRIGIKGKLQMGFPEVKLGLHPGFGGTFRSVELIDPVEAMTMMLTGKPKFDKQCKKAGLVDEYIEERHYKAAVKAVVAGKIKRHEQNLANKTLNTKAARTLAAKKMRKETAKKAPKAHYPAPYATIDLWEEFGGDPKAMQKGEIKSFSKMMLSETARNLIRVFFLQQKLKGLARAKSGIKHVHVVGAGAMGGDIAGWCALQGMTVTLADMKTEPVAKAVKNTAKLCKDKHKSEIETRDVLDRLIPDIKGLGVSKADLIIEAVPEDKDLKHKVYKTLEKEMKKDAILATNTSSIPLEELAKGLKNPERLVGLHFFNPVPKMMLVEVVKYAKTDQDVFDRALGFSGQIGKLPTPVKSYPGFLVNRALMPYLMEALVVLDEGVEKETIDKAAEEFGMPMGPIELADQVGLDICLHVAQMLTSSLDVPLPAIPGWLQEKVDKGELGRKTGKGFYDWSKGKAEKDEDKAGKVTQELTDRLLLPLLNACVECYREGVVDDLEIMDGAMIFGTGYAPFRGGPMNYAKTRGVDDIVASLEKLADKHGDRFKPDAGWKKVKKDLEKEKG